LFEPDAVQTLGHLAISENEVVHRVAPFIYDTQYLYLYRYWKQEDTLARHVARLKQQTVPVVDPQVYLSLLSDEHQQQALSMVCQHALNIITGGPGTGKTYTLARIIAALNQSLPNLRIAMAAPTGKAAQRMKEALQNALNDEILQPLVTPALKQLNPVTLHRLLGLGHSARPRYDAEQPLPYDVIVVDEASMLDLNLASMLLAAVPNQARLILLGDANQLASVDVGAVLADLQQVNALQENRVHLKTSRRFDGEALIGQMAAFIQQPIDDATSPQALLEQFHQQVVAPTAIQAVPLLAKMPNVLQLEYFTQAHPTSEQYYDQLMLGYQHYIEVLKTHLTAEDPEVSLQHVIQVFDDYRILTAIRHGAFGLKQLNQQMEQRLLNELSRYTTKQGDWYVGRPVMMTYNDYQLGLSNGDIGICFKRQRQGQSQFEVYFPSLEKWVLATRLPKSIETAFALTIHKSQGSEFTHTAVVLDAQAQNLLSQELLYTAITRAKTVVSLLADPQALAQALSKRTTRVSGVLEKIKGILDY
jgi:exodeoxyribonuclease V alpha subunit